MDKFPDMKWVEDTISDHLDLTIKTNQIDLENLMNGKSLLVVKVGTDDHPASSEDIENVRQILSKIIVDPGMCLVTHHAIDFEVFPIREDFLEQFK